nr:photosystem II protein M [Cuscuta corymbosa var. stylosa]WEY29987.1 photosystem II protein M [Cuscuta corymbosa var. stylosa]
MEVNIFSFSATALLILFPTALLLTLYVKTVSQDN